MYKEYLDNFIKLSETDFSDINDVVMNYSDSAKLLTKLKLDKDLFIISSDNRDIAKVTVDNQNNVFVNSSEFISSSILPIQGWSTSFK